MPRLPGAAGTDGASGGGSARSLGARPRTSSGRSCGGLVRRRGRGWRSPRRRRGVRPSTRPRNTDMRWSATNSPRTAWRYRPATSPPATIAAAASRPVSSAWPMPSPVITSVAAAASPVNRTGPCESVAVSMRAGIGHARCRSTGAAHGPRAAATCGRSKNVAHVCFMSWVRRTSAAPDAEADVGTTVRERERPRVAGQEVVVEPDDQLARGRTGDAVDVLAEGMPLAEVARRDRARAPCASGSTCRRRRPRVGR